MQQEIFSYLLAIALLSIRVGALFVAFPFFSHQAITPLVKIFATLSLSVALYPAVSSSLPPWVLSLDPQVSDILTRAIFEFVVGAGMGLVAKWIFSSAVSSAHWVGTQMGFSMGGIFSPENGADNSAWSEYINWIALMVFLAIGGHHLMLSAIKDSYVIESAEAWASIMSAERSTMFWIELGSTFFLWMLKLSAPMVVVLLLLQAGLGVLSKFVPQINLWVVSIPITLAAGVFVFTMLSPMYGDALGEMFQEQGAFQYNWLKFLGAR